MDHLLEMQRQQVEALNKLGSRLQGLEGQVNTSEPTAQSPAENIDGMSDITVPVETTGEQDVQKALVPDELPDEKSPVSDQQNPVGGSDDLDKAIEELAALVWLNTSNDEASKENESKPESVPVEDIIPTVEENKNFKKLYDEELERKLQVEGEARQAAAEAKYRKSMFDKESEKSYSNIDKQKELEAELRLAKSAQMPEKVAPLWQSYLLWQESNTPVHKYRAVKNALDLVEEMTWVSAMDYYEQILRAENKDIPEWPEQSKTNTKTNTDEHKLWNSFLSL